MRRRAAETEEEIKMVAEKNPVIGEAYSRLRVMSEDEANRMIYEARLKAQRDEYSRIQGALLKDREEGRQEGREEGRQEGREEKLKIVRNLKNLGIPVEQIARATGLSIDELAAL
ncbi:MAG: Rpn family recombination-promoting nuclease/putative transposase [Treponema sp.]|jgi:predicted transposase/invertase (TIGR01784 family)|nr:Rpn family recombination-promoting nuclease/putative transposase [Treponema sp.]